MYSIGDVYYKLGKYKEALLWFRKSLDKAKALYQNIEHPFIAELKRSIGAAHSMLGKDALAVEYFIESLEMLKSIFGAEVVQIDMTRQYITIGRAAVHPGISEQHMNIGLVYLDMSKYQLALDHMTRALNMAEELYGKHSNHINLAISYINIGAVYAEQNKYDTALEYYKKSMDINKKDSDDKSERSLALYYNNIGSAHRKIGKHREALEYLEKALELNEQAFGLNSHHPNIAANLINIANVYNDQENYEQALTAALKSLTMYKECYGETANHRNLTTVYYAIATAYKGQTKYKEALENALKSLDILKVLFQEAQNRDIARTYVLVGDIYTCTGEYTLALQNLHDGLKILISISDTELVNTEAGKCFQKIFNIYKELGNLYSAQDTDPRMS